MAATASSLIPAGTPLPPFSLKDVVWGRGYRPESFAKASGLLVAFICRHCPYVVHMRGELVKIASDFSPRGLQAVAICSNDAEAYPEDAPPKLREMAERFPFPLLYDETQEVAGAFGAACTPDLFLYDSRGGLFYRGRLDDSSPGNGKPVTGIDLRRAIQSLLDGASPPAVQHPGIGCSIKWKKT
ncbi:MAG: thioredoxin family protein [Terrimicrobiaceae bacterium]|nr:thioredoxin family protein [Terrimicrobiaceae bacterium]